MNSIALSDDSREKIKTSITDYQGGEIFFGCKVNETGIIYEVTAICFGNDTAVLAPYEIAKNFNAILHNHPSGNIQPSDNDLYVASSLQNEGIGFFIVDNKVNKLNIVVPPVLTKEIKKIDISEIRTFFKEDGTLSKKKDGYEHRKDQEEMSVKIAEAFNENKIALIEAGTGIGKSLAYLIPAIHWVEQNKTRVVIATNTINLQNQLLLKDIPFAKNALDIDVKTELVKGRRNYICKLKVYNLNNELEFEEDNEQLKEILKWTNTTSNGDVDDLNFIPDSLLWEKVSSEVDFCIGRHCMFFSSCFYQIARRKASEANILIANHHILFADLQIRSEGRGMDENLLLPPYRKIIIDEAHNIEKNAASFFAFSFSKNTFLKFLTYLKKKRGNSGLFITLKKKLSKETNEKAEEILELITDNCLTKLTELQDKSIDIFNKIIDYLYSNKVNDTQTAFLKKVSQFRIKDQEFLSTDFHDNVIVYLEELITQIEELLKAIEEVTEKLNKPIFLSTYEIDIKLLKSYYNKLSSFGVNLANILNSDSSEYIKWIELSYDTLYTNFKITATPLYVNKILSENLFKAFDTIVLTSATLTVNKKFDFFNHTTGLGLVKDRNIETAIYPSPFDYENRVLFIIPEHMPEPTAFEYNEKLNEYIKETVLLTGGSSFVLFTSYHQLKQSFEEAGKFLKENGIPCYVQGEMEKTTLLNTFIREIKSTLFATNSFWEGVDAPGETLRYVILAKLPFNMPSDPIEEAKIEDMERKGINSFMNYTLPNAIIKFKQGFGRLMRKKDDYGIVAILDSRILKKQYGKLFFHSLPRCKFVSSNLDKISEAIRKHIAIYETKSSV